MLCTWGSQIPGWVLSGASADLNFAAGTYFPQPLSSSITTTRASTGYAQTSAGLLVPFASNIPRITDQGLLVEESRTNVVLWDRDLSNAAWTKSNVTAALDQTGADGSANSASSLTATAGNGTVLQAITLASSARFQSAYVKRITGSGVINMTMDNGATWTAISPTASWTKLSIPTQTLANPTVGFQIVTNGDAIAVDFVQNENGAFATSVILTTTVAVTRAADSIFLNASTTPLPPFSFRVAGTPTIANGNYLLGFVGTDTLRLNIAPQLTLVTKSGAATIASFATGNSATAGAALKAAGRIFTADYQVALNGTLAVANTTAGALPTVFSNLKLGDSGFAAAQFDGYFSRLTFFPGRLSDAQLQALTT